MPTVSPLRELILILVSEISLPAIIQRGDNIVYANKAVQDLFGYSEAQLMHLKALDLAAPEERPRLHQYNQSRIETNTAYTPTTYHCRALHSQGHRFDVAIVVCAAHSVQDNEELLFFVVIQQQASTALIEFSDQVASYLHEWSKSYLRNIAANLVQTTLHGQEVKQYSITEWVDALSIKVDAIEERQLFFKRQLIKGLKYSSAAALVIGQEVSLGLGKELVKWIKHLMF